MHHNLTLRLAALALALCPLCPTWAETCPEPTGRYSYTTVSLENDAANNVVVDAHTNLQWRRCTHGQTWSGTACVGYPTNLDHEAALRLAHTQGGWRLPNVTELNSIVDVCKGTSPTIDAAAFPDTYKTWFWTATGYAGDASSALIVGFIEGVIDKTFRDNSSGAVRLVRVTP